MGKRRLAYNVRRFQDGLYVLLTLEGAGSGIAELERRLRVTEPVIKYLTVRIDEEQKRLAKVKKLREMKRRPEPAAEAGTETAAATV
jgi:small subunit ribosomal protein S6